jgi:hypothetical protein
LSLQPVLRWIGAAPIETGKAMGATMSIRVYSLFTDRRVFELTVRRGAGLFVHAGRFELAWNSQGFVVCRGTETVVHWG